MNTTTSLDSGLFVTLDPFKCRVWKLNNRAQEGTTELACRAEIQSIALYGQLVPAIGRPLEGDPEFTAEIICGMRRLFVARHLKIPLRVELRELSDREAAAVIETEESSHKKINPYERAMWLAMLLKQNIFCSQDEMARDLGINPVQVTRLLNFASLPAVVVGAFSSPDVIPESWAIELHKACGDERRAAVIERACALNTVAPRPPAASVYEMLMSPREWLVRNSRLISSRVVKRANGEPLVRFERQRRNVVLRIPNALVDANVENAVTEAIIAVLNRRLREGCADAA